MELVDDAKNEPIHFKLAYVTAWPALINKLVRPLFIARLTATSHVESLCPNSTIIVHPNLNKTATLATATSFGQHTPWQ